MGQYWYPVNLDKREFIHPHKLATGLKLWEQLSNAPGTGAALLILCAAQREARGGGDFAMVSDPPEPYDPKLPKGYAEIAKRTIGRWAGDRIALVGDYAEDADLAPEHAASRIYFLCSGAAENRKPGETPYTDVTADVCAVIEYELGGKFKGKGWREWIEGGKS